MNQKKRIELAPIGRVEVDETQGLYRLNIFQPYRPALRGLGSCTHAVILWWADRLEQVGGRAGQVAVQPDPLQMLAA